MRSVLATTEVSIEFVVVDDVSSDASRAAISAAAAVDPRVKPVFAERNHGLSGARNLGIAAATGHYISLIDCDDLFLPETVRMQLAAFERLRATEPALSLLTSDAWLINERGERKGRYISPEWWGVEAAGDVPLWTLPSTFFFERGRAAEFFEPYRLSDGPIFVSRMQKIGPIGFVGEPLIEYRLRMSSVTNRRGAEVLRQMKAADASRKADRLDSPFLPDEVPEPDAREVAAWIHGRNAKNAALNGRVLTAGTETLRAALADPGKTFRKILRAASSLGR